MLERFSESRPYIITVGNEKGGTGKSTTAMHLAVALLNHGYSVGCIDLDGRQATLSHYLTNRQALADSSTQEILVPAYRCLTPSNAPILSEAQDADQRALQDAIESLKGNDFLVVDTPGSDTTLCRLGHLLADSLITPLNDSFVDIDVIAQIDREKRVVLAPSNYCKMVWEQNNQRVVQGKQPIDWVVMRNRLAHLDARNGREISDLLTQLAKRIGFRLAPGFGERVVFRELFLKGATLFDNEPLGQTALTSSHRNAKNEVESLLYEIGLIDSGIANTG